MKREREEKASEERERRERESEEREKRKRELTIKSRATPGCPTSSK